jgi:hypothetical protein
MAALTEQRSLGGKLCEKIRVWLMPVCVMKLEEEVWTQKREGLLEMQMVIL